MKLLALFGLPALLLTLGLQPASTAPAAAAGGTFEIDGGHSSVVYSVKHAGASWFYGTFNELSGSFTMDAESPTNSKVLIEIAANSIDSRSADRDAHLTSADFFNAVEFPTIIFESKSVAKTDGGLAITGDLTLLGKTKQVVAQAVHTGDGEFHGKRQGWEAKFEISRSDFGMTYGIDKNVLGDTVRVTVALEGVQR